MVGVNNNWISGLTSVPMLGGGTASPTFENEIILFCRSLSSFFAFLNPVIIGNSDTLGIIRLAIILIFDVNLVKGLTKIPMFFFLVLI